MPPARTPVTAPTSGGTPTASGRGSGGTPNAPAPSTARTAHELREALGDVIRRLRAEAAPGEGRFAVLGRLHREGPMSSADLATADRVRPQSMAQTVRELEERGFVTRRPDPADGRRAFVELTDAGRERLLAIRVEREAWLTAALDDLFDDDERAQLAAAIPLLARLADA
ncbi:MarR family winged helix-turn-helix transcriptional regulator [Patulibacter minatonensis]|uniref:MarR family winged helix-turn-helix transcriptional regulator n=1 Tax=Patulibacter minatonensis TaxID=298163 RepID=UPI0004AC858C|nr:MarR family transcriptional regulator [Patulibacter minatonensis]